MRVFFITDTKGCYPVESRLNWNSAVDKGDTVGFFISRFSTENNYNKPNQNLSLSKIGRSKDCVCFSGHLIKSKVLKVDDIKKRVYVMVINPAEEEDDLDFGCIKLKHGSKLWVCKRKLLDKNWFS